MPDEYDDDDFAQKVKIKPQNSASTNALNIARKVAGVTLELVGATLNVIPGVGEKKVVRHGGDKHWSDEYAIKRGSKKEIKVNAIQRAGWDLQKPKQNKRIAPIEVFEKDVSIDSSTASDSSEKSNNSVNMKIPVVEIRKPIAVESAWNAIPRKKPAREAEGPNRI